MSLKERPSASVMSVSIASRVVPRMLLTMDRSLPVGINERFDRKRNKPGEARWTLHPQIPEWSEKSCTQHASQQSTCSPSVNLSMPQFLTVLNQTRVCFGKMETVQLPVMALTRLLLPTLGRPTIATAMADLSMSCSSTSFGGGSTCANSLLQVKGPVQRLHCKSIICFLHLACKDTVCGSSMARCWLHTAETQKVLYSNAVRVGGRAKLGHECSEYGAVQCTRCHDRSTRVCT